MNKSDEIRSLKNELQEIEDEFSRYFMWYDPAIYRTYAYKSVAWELRLLYARKWDRFRKDIGTQDTIPPWVEQSSPELTSLLHERKYLIEQLVSDVEQFVQHRLRTINLVDARIEGVVNGSYGYHAKRHIELDKMRRDRLKKLFKLETQDMRIALHKILKNGHRIYWIKSRRHLPNKSGVYLLVRDGELEYVGQSCDLRKRIRPSHHTYECDNHLIGIIIVSDEGERKRLEQLLIRQLRPSANINFSVDIRQMELV